MIEQIQATLDEAFYPAELVNSLKEAKTDAELLKIARDIVASMRMAEEISFKIQKVLYAEKNNK